MAIASNVKIARSGGLLNLIQLFEYVICHQMKKAQTVFNIEYIIGGIGSIFRKSYLQKINYFDENTVTEDIDITMKILRAGNKNVRVLYASDVIAYTQSALTVSDLIRQRYRWKWGRYQTFVKNRLMFFSRDFRYTKGLSWFYLPFALYSDLAFFLEPVILTYLIYIVISFADIKTLLSSVAIITFYFNFNILGEETLNLKDKLKMIALAPLMYFLFYVLSFVEYVALLKSLIRIPYLKKSLEGKECSWTPIRHSGISLR